MAASGIATVSGGSANPASSGAYNLPIGAGGDTLNGGSGRRNILVAGANPSTLNAGDGEDLRIGGSTSYDAEASLTTWQLIATYWAGSDDYATRVDCALGPISEPDDATASSQSCRLAKNGGMDRVAHPTYQ